MPRTATSAKTTSKAATAAKQPSKATTTTAAKGRKQAEGIPNPFEYKPVTSENVKTSADEPKKNAQTKVSVNAQKKVKSTEESTNAKKKIKSTEESIDAQKKVKSTDESMNAKKKVKPTLEESKAEEEISVGTSGSTKASTLNSPGSQKKTGQTVSPKGKKTAMREASKTHRAPKTTSAKPKHVDDDHEDDEDEKDSDYQEDQDEEEDHDEEDHDDDNNHEKDEEEEEDADKGDAGASESDDEPSNPNGKAEPMYIIARTSGGILVYDLRKHEFRNLFLRVSPNFQPGFAGIVSQGDFAIYIKNYADVEKKFPNFPFRVPDNLVLEPDTENPLKQTAVVGYITKLGETKQIKTKQNANAAFREVDVTVMSQEGEYHSLTVALWGNISSSTVLKERTVVFLVNLKQTVFQDQIRFQMGDYGRIISLDGNEAAKAWAKKVDQFVKKAAKQYAAFGAPQGFT